MYKGRTRFALLALVLLVGLITGGCSGNSSGLPTTQMEIKGHKFTIEIASTTTQRRTGLMARDSLPEDGGMIFVFGRPDTYSFWMHNTRIPLDIIWLTGQGDVVHIATLAAYDERGHESPEPALYVIELNAGRALQLGLKSGDHIALPEDVLKTKGDTADD